MMKRKLIYFILLFLYSFKLSAQWTQVSPPFNNFQQVKFVNATVGYAITITTIAKTTDGGVTWNTIVSPTNKIFEALDIVGTDNVYAVGYDFTNSNGFVCMTNNGGGSWIQNTVGTERLYSIDMVTTSIGYIGTDDGTVLKTTNGGTVWGILATGLTSGYTVTKVFFLDANNGYIIGDASSCLILKTTNGGTNWTILSVGISGDWYGLFCNSISEVHIVGQDGRYRKSIDGGANWAAISTFTTEGFNDIVFTDLNTGYITGTNSTVLKTVDAGNTWNSQNTGIYYEIENITFLNSTIGYINGKQRIFKTTDAGNTWSVLYVGLPELETVCFTDVNTGYVGGTNEAIYKTTNGGSTWQEVITPGIDYYSKIIFTDANTGYAVNGDATLLKTIDAGVTWNLSNTGITSGADDIQFINSNTGFALDGSAAILYKTIDAGATWTSSIIGTTDYLNSIYFVDENTGFVVGTPGRIMKTTNGGVSWTDLTSVHGGILYDICFENSLTGYIVGSSGRIQKTTNGGVTWTSQTSNTTESLYNVQFTSPNVGFASGSDENILATIDGGITWVNQRINTTTFINFNGLHFFNGDHGYVVGTSGKIMKYEGNDITNVTLSADPVCANASATVSFLPTGTFNGGNIYTAQLSDASGSFNTPLNIGTGNTSPITVTIPALSPTGSGYKIRVIASNPISIGDSSTSFNVTGLSAIDAGINGTSCANAPSFTLTGFSPAGGIWSGIGVNASGIFTPHKMMAGSIITLTYTAIINGCPNTDTKTLTLSLPASVITPNANLLSAPTGAGYQYQWYSNGALISGAINQQYLAPTIGNYSVRVADGTCVDTSSNYNVTTFMDLFPMPSGVTNALRSVHFPSSTTGYAVGHNGRILTTTNSGITWTSQASGTTQILRSVYFPSTTLGIAVGESNTIRRFSGGTWTTITGTGSFNSVHMPSTTIGYTRGAVSTGLKTTDGGATWAASTNSATFIANSAYFVSTTIGYVVGNGGNIYKTINGSTFTSTPSGTTNNLNCVHFPSSTTGIIVGNGGIILRTLNSGSSWFAAASGTTQNLYGVYFTDDNTGYVVGQGGIVLKTMNGGSSWDRLTNVSTEDLYSVNFPIASEGYAVGANGTILKYIVPVNEIGALGISPQSVCTGSTVDISYITNGVFNAGNVFTIELSNASGNFASPTVLGTATNSPIIKVLIEENDVAIPVGIPTGDGYKFRIRSSDPYIISDPNNVSILIRNGVPSISPQPIDRSINYTTSTSFNAGVSETGATYQWEVNMGSGYTTITNGGVYSGAITSTLNLTNVPMSMNGYLYRCMITNICGTAISNQALLTVICPLPTITLQPVDVVTYDGYQSAPFKRFRVTASGTNTYQWQVDQGGGFADIINGGVYSGATSNMLQISSISITSNGYLYRCVVTNACGSINSNAATLSVYPKIFTKIYDNQIMGTNSDDHFEFGDYDNDNDLDVLVIGQAAGIYQNTGSGFVEVYDGLLPSLYGGCGKWGDYDRDGKLDLLVSGGFSPLVSKIFRNTGSGFIEVYTGALTPLESSACDWGDFDNDGDLDIVLSGDNGTVEVSKIYQNTGVGFTEVYTGTLIGLSNGTAEWGDYDIDGDLDILLSGSYSAGVFIPITKIYQNTGSGFSEVYPGSLNGIRSGFAIWGDYDADGDLDILLSGYYGASLVTSKIYQNTGSGFSEVYPGTIIPLGSSSGNWADIDNDGDLDIVISGNDNSGAINDATRIYLNTGSGFVLAYADQMLDSEGIACGDIDNDGDLDIIKGGYYTMVYRNDITPANQPPAAPLNLNISVSGSDVTFTWNKATDGLTTQNGLSYNLMLGTSAYGYDIISPASASSGYRYVVKKGNVDVNQSWTIHNLSPGTYYWGVQAIDAGYMGSPFATAAFTIGNSVPAISTNDISAITYTSATSGGNIIIDGGSFVTARGICWSITPNPTILDNITANGTGAGSFTSNITGLMDGTTYYVRAYATNANGTEYGDQKIFTTPQIVLASITTNSVSNITNMTAVSGGNISSDGGAPITERGICWTELLVLPTILHHKVSNGTGMGSYTCNLTNLIPNTIYFVRAYAINSEGVAYGIEESFITGNSVTDIVHVYDENSVLITPNPANYFINLELPSVKESDVDIIITDSKGEIVQKETLRNFNKEKAVNISNLAQGHYCMTVLLSSEEVFAKKFVIIR